MKRFKTINVNGSEIVNLDIENFLDNIDAPYCVDDSHFTPMSEAVKQCSKARSYTDEELKQMYDFIDGKDTGAKIPINRQHGVGDIVEISNAINEASDALKDEIDTQTRVNELMASMDNSQPSEE